MTAPDPYVERARKWLEDYVGSVGTILKDNLAAEFRAVAAEAQREAIGRTVAGAKRIVHEELAPLAGDFAEAHDRGYAEGLEAAAQCCEPLASRRFTESDGSQSIGPGGMTAMQIQERIRALLPQTGGTHERE